MTFNWQKEPGLLEIIVPVSTRKGPGTYLIHAAKRPDDCDRGDWEINVTTYGSSDLDWADGFPRYFFGSEEDVKKQIETWILRRSETIKI